MLGDGGIGVDDGANNTVNGNNSSGNDGDSIGLRVFAIPVSGDRVVVVDPGR